MSSVSSDKHHRANLDDSGIPAGNSELDHPRIEKNHRCP